MLNKKSAGIDMSVWKYRHFFCSTTAYICHCRCLATSVEEDFTCMFGFYSCRKLFAQLQLRHRSKRTNPTPHSCVNSLFIFL